MSYVYKTRKERFRCTPRGAKDPIISPKGPCSPYIWVLVPKKALKTQNKEYLDPFRKVRRFRIVVM